MKLSNMTWRARALGYFLLIGGCLTLAYFFVNISGQTHFLWIFHAQHLPEGEMIPRTEAVASLRNFQLQANWLFRNLIFLPTAAMFIGGIILGIGKKEEKHQNKTNPED
jgi:hypothetical protein